MTHLFKKKTIQKITVLLLVILLNNILINTNILYANQAVGSDAGHTENSIKGAIEKNPAWVDKIKEDIKIKAKDKLGYEIDDDFCDKIFSKTYDNSMAIFVKYSINGPNQIPVYNGIDLRLSKEDLENIKNGTYQSNLATQESEGQGQIGITNVDYGYEGKDHGIDGGILFTPIAFLVRSLGDAANYIIQGLMEGSWNSISIKGPSEEVNTYIQANPPINNEETEIITFKIVKDYIDTWWAGNFRIPNIKITPAEIFSGNVTALDASFFDQDEDYSNKIGGENKSIVKDLKGVIAQWYVALRNIAIVGLMSVLLYIGIKIIISSNAAEKAKYKEFFIDWLIALCLIFFLHYIMAFTMSLSKNLTKVFAGNSTQNGTIKQANIQLINEDAGGTPYPNRENNIYFASNFAGVTRMKSEYENAILAMGYSVLYFALTGYTIYFIFIYLKRLLMLAFFTMIAPLVALSYPLDKMGDTKAQAFNYWLKEYIFYAFLQPLHMLLYTVFVSSTISIAANNLLFAIVTLAFIVPAEKIVKQMFGISGKTESSVGGFAGGMVASKVFDMIGKGKKGKVNNVNGSGQQKIRQKNNPNINYTNTMLNDGMASGGSGSPAGGSGSPAGGSVSPAGGSVSPAGGSVSPAGGSVSPAGGSVSPAGGSGSPAGGSGSPVGGSESPAGGSVSPAGGSGSPVGGSVSPAGGFAGTSMPTGKMIKNPRALLNSAANGVSRRYTNAGGWQAIGKNVGKKVVKGLGKGYVKTLGIGTLAATGLGMGVVGGNMSDTLKGLSAGAVAGSALGDKANSAIDNTLTYNSSAGRFIGETLYGGEEGLDKHIALQEYKNNSENRARALKELQKGGHKVKKEELEKRLEQEANMAYDSGSNDYSAIKEAIKIENDPKNTQYSHEYIASALQLSPKYSDSQLMDPKKFQIIKDRVGTNLENKGLSQTQATAQATKMMDLIRTIRKV